MKVITKEQAQGIAYKYLKTANTLAVTEDGSIHVNCDLDVLKDSEEKEIFILVGELSSKKSKKIKEDGIE